MKEHHAVKASKHRRDVGSRAEGDPYKKLSDKAEKCKVMARGKEGEYLHDGSRVHGKDHHDPDKHLSPPGKTGRAYAKGKISDAHQIGHGKDAGSHRNTNMAGGHRIGSGRATFKSGNFKTAGMSHGKKGD